MNLPQAAFDAHDDYAAGRIPRRAFVNRLRRVAPDGVDVPAILTALEPRDTPGRVSPDNPAIRVSRVVFGSPDGHGTGRGCLAVPAGDAPHPAVLVLHDHRGLDPQTEDAARRLAQGGFAALAPDALFALGGRPRGPGGADKAAGLQRSLAPDDVAADFAAAAGFLQAHDACNGKLAAVGFGAGGSLAFRLAAATPDLFEAAVAFCSPPPAEALPAPLLAHLAELDARVNADWPAFEEAMKTAGTACETHVYPGVQHAFFSDADGRYDEPAADLAWERTLAFLAQHLGVPVRN